MNSMKHTLMLTLLSFSVYAVTPIQKRPLNNQNLESSFKKFITVYAGCLFIGTYGYLYWQSESTMSQNRLLGLALGYSGGGFSMATATYFASLLWAESGLFQEKLSKASPIQDK
jgi:hypothetical protein